MTVSRVFVANRGEIALRIILACREAGIETVLGVSEADRDSVPAEWADRSVCIGPAAGKSSYLDPQAVIAAALGTGCDALHPGYGFLAERADFAAACVRAGLTFIGPPATAMESLGDKLRSREIARRAGVPILPASENLETLEDAFVAAEALGFPLLLKASGGGGGRGIHILRTEADLVRTFELARSEVSSAFGDSRLYLERYVAKASHVEVQVLADAFGNVIHLGERDCSMQRRFQKIIEEAPPTFATLSPDRAAEVREVLRSSAVALAKAVSYQSAGTVEFIVDQDRGECFFLEMNTRIQVEHPVTEEVTGIDLVGEQLAVAAGRPLSITQGDVHLVGAAIECRITAESVPNDFRPAPGTIKRWRQPMGPGVRVDTHCREGVEISVYYDSMIAKVICRGRDRAHAIRRMRSALASLEVDGVETNTELLQDLISTASFEQGAYDTNFIAAFLARRS